MKTKEAVAVSGDSENEFEVDEPEEVDDHSDDEWAPSAAVKTPGKRGRPAKNTPGRKKKAPKVEEDDEDEEEILPKKARGSSKPKPPPTPAKGRGRVAKAKAKKEEPEDEDELDDDELVDEEDDDVDDEDDDVDDDEDEYDDEEEEEEEEVLNQGPNAKPAKKFTSGAFVVLKTDMLGKGNPPVWKIDGKALLQKYISFKQDGKILYKNTSVYSGWGTNVKEQYYSAPVSFIQQTRKEHIIEFYKDKIKKCFKDPKNEDAANKEIDEEAAELAEHEDKYDEDEA